MLFLLLTSLSGLTLLSNTNWQRVAKTLAITSLICLYGLPVQAQVASLWARDLPAQNAQLPSKLTPPPPSPPPTPSPTITKKEIALFTLLQASTIYDFETTFRPLKGCPTCREGNPILRPFVKAGRPATYAFGTGVNILLFTATHQLRKSHKKWWYVPIVVHSAIHVWAGMHNQSVARRLR